MLYIFIILLNILIEKGLLEGQIPVYEEKSFMDCSTAFTSEIMIG